MTRQAGCGSVPPARSRGPQPYRPRGPSLGRNKPAKAAAVWIAQKIRGVSVALCVSWEQGCRPCSIFFARQLTPSQARAIGFVFLLSFGFAFVEARGPALARLLKGTASAPPPQHGRIDHPDPRRSADDPANPEPT